MAAPNIKPVVLYGLLSCPNPIKVAIILDFLGIPFEQRGKEFTDCKQPDQLALNPNGRAPTLIDPNTGITLWESGAIIEYLVETYDTENTISFSTFPEKHQLKQWLYFQASGQGPYFGQLVWFSWYHGEILDSAIERYDNEVRRVLGVLDLALKDKDWLVGDRMSCADLALVPWFYWAANIQGKEYWSHIESELPHFYKWWDKLRNLEVVKKLCDGIGGPNLQFARQDVRDKFKV
ncbi:glutathione S- transferase, nitrogen catabolite repression regulator [Myotisia sp. PD_48]|nr:glutathione S- transferase, nitrogen catabolite repression regulator [Myotisia sp. PD_48]